MSSMVLALASTQRSRILTIVRELFDGYTGIGLELGHKLWRSSGYELLVVAVLAEENVVIPHLHDRGQKRGILLRMAFSFEPLNLAHVLFIGDKRLEKLGSRPPLSPL